MRTFINSIFLIVAANFSVAQEITVTKFNKKVTTPVLLQTQNQKLVKGINSENFIVKSEANSRTSANSNNIISDVTMIDKEYGFALGSEIINGGYYAGGAEVSKIWITKDGVETWGNFVIDADEKLRYIKLIAIDENNFFLHASPNSYLSKDGGKTWAKTVNAPTTYLSKLTVYKNGIIVAAGSTKATYSTDFGNTWKALNLPEGFNLEAITLEGQMIGVIVQENTLKLLTVEEELNFDISKNEFVERTSNNFPDEIKNSKKRFFKSHENGDFTLIYNLPSITKNVLSSGISVFSSRDNGESWNKEFDYKEENFMHIKDVKKDEEGIYIVAPHELIAYTTPSYNEQTDDETSSDNNLEIEEQKIAQGVLLFPNPTTSTFTIQSNNELSKVVVYDIYGRNIQNINSTQNQIEIDLSGEQTGIYFIHITNGEETIIEKIIKR